MENNKPLILAMSELEDTLVSDINKSGVPAFLVRRILETILIKVQELEKQELNTVLEKEKNAEKEE